VVMVWGVVPVYYKSTTPSLHSNYPCNLGGHSERGLGMSSSGGARIFNLEGG